MGGQRGEVLLREIEMLRAKLDDAEDTLRAIRDGEADALVVTGSTGQRVYSLAGPQHAYRLLIEQMSEGALTLGSDGGVLYCNQSVATMLKKPLGQVLGHALDSHLAEADRARFFTLLRRAQDEATRGEITFLAADDAQITTLASFGTMMLENARVICVVLTDLREQKRAEERIGLLNTSLQRKNTELERQNRQVQEANRLKSVFLANMSHELRTPLNGIIGLAQLMHDEQLGPVAADHKEYLGDILTSSQHLLGLINDVLDLAKVESGTIDFRPEPVDLARILDGVRDVVRTLAAEKRIHITSEVDPCLRHVVVDPARLKQVLYNYVSNALKFTTIGGCIHVRADPEGEDSFRLEVEDSGIGIRAEDIDRLFIEFHQLDEGAGKQYGGTGLGLALTKQIVEAQGGRVGVASQIGNGSRFFAVLPRIAKPTRPPHPCSADAPGPQERPPGEPP